jgi:hypothetical protein
MNEEQQQSSTQLDPNAYETMFANAQTEAKQYREQVRAEDNQMWHDNATFTDKLSDIPRGILSGAEGFGQSVAKLGDSITESMGGDLFDNESITTRAAQTHTFLGGATSGITQFALGFIPFAGVAGKVSKAYQLTGLREVGRRSALAGAGADFVAFDAHEQRLSNTLSEMDSPILNNAVTRYLAAKDDDQWAEGRFKQVLEGVGLGAMTELAFKGLRHLKILKSGNKEAIKDSLKQLEESAHMAQLPRADQRHPSRVESRSGRGSVPPRPISREGEGTEERG